MGGCYGLARREWGGAEPCGVVMQRAECERVEMMSHNDVIRCRIRCRKKKKYIRVAPSVAVVVHLAAPGDGHIRVLGPNLAVVPPNERVWQKWYQACM